MLNIIYNILNIILIVFLLFYVVPMFISITIGNDSIFDFYEDLSIIIMIISCISFFIINLALGISNIHKKNIAIGVLNIISGCLSLGNILLIIAYDGFFDDPWGYLLFTTLTAQTILSIIILVLNIKKEDAPLNKIHLVLSCFIIIIGIILTIMPRVLLQGNMKRLSEAYNILAKEPKPQLLIDKDSNFYNSDGKLVAQCNYEVLDVDKADDEGTYFISVMDENNQLWIVDYTGNKLVRLYYAFCDSDLFVYTLCSFKDSYRPHWDPKKDGINYLTLQNETNNLLVFANDNKDILIEVKIDYTQKEDDNSFLNLLKTRSFDSALETIYTYKKEYYLTYKNNEKIKLDCNNLLIDYNVKEGEYNLLLYNNYNIPFYDKTESGYFDLEGTKYTISNNNIIVYNTFKNYIIMYDYLQNFYYISTLDFNHQQKVYNLTYCTESYVLTMDDFYLIKDDAILKIITNIDHTTNIGKDSPGARYGSVYNDYIQ